MKSSLIWITGVRGFIGTRLAKELSMSGQKIVGFVRDDASINFTGEESAIFPLSPDGMALAVSCHGPPDRVYHLAGAPTVGQSMTNPHGDFLANVATTEILLEALRALKSRVPLVLASSAAVYGDLYNSPIDISAKPAPTSPYGHHKLIAEQLVQAHAEAFDLPATICRLFSIYGPGLRKQLLYDACTRLAKTSNDMPLKLGGTGAEKRDWLHVGDLTAGLATISNPSAGEVRKYNLGSGTGTEISSVADCLVESWGHSRTICFSGESRAGDPFNLVASPSSLPPRFKPKNTISEGLLEYVCWFRRERSTGTGTQ